VQRFEFAYEISHAMLKRYLKQISPTPEQYNTMAFSDLIRSGNEQGLLLGDWTQWKIYRDMRSKTSHTYDQEIAISVVAGIPSFLDEVRYLRDQLKKRLS
jgi:nucleotidyltransferase substrate binding protein (TIGR01987 family)